MNDHTIKTLMHQRQEQILAEIRAAQTTQLKWQGIVLKACHRLNSILQGRKASLSNRFPGGRKGIE